MSEDLPRYRVRISEHVSQELEDIFNFIEKQSFQNAVALIARILDMIESLNTLPYRFSKAKLRHRPENEQLRRVVVDSYIIEYRIDEANKIVLILSVQHGASEYFA